MARRSVIVGLAVLLSLAGVAAAFAFTTHSVRNHSWFGGGNPLGCAENGQLPVLAGADVRVEGGFTLLVEVSNPGCIPYHVLRGEADVHLTNGMTLHLETRDSVLAPGSTTIVAFEVTRVEIPEEVLDGSPDPEAFLATEEGTRVEGSVELGLPAAQSVTLPFEMTL